MPGYIALTFWGSSSVSVAIGIHGKKYILYYEFR